MRLVDAAKAAGATNAFTAVMDWPLHLPADEKSGSFALSWAHVSKVLSMARARSPGTRWETTTEGRALEVLRNCLCPFAHDEAISGDERKRTTVTASSEPLSSRTMIQPPSSW